MRLRHALAAGLLAIPAMIGSCGPRRISSDVVVVAALRGDPLARKLQEDPIAVLEEGVARYDRNVTDYTCTLYKLERVNPAASEFLPEQQLECKFRDKPFSVFTSVVVNPRGGRAALYVEGKWDNKMLVKPAGLGWLIGTVVVEPRGKQARANTLRFIDQFGFKRSLQTMIASYKIARQEGLFKLVVAGEAKIDGREAIVLDVRINEPEPSGRFEYPHVRSYLDREWLLPIGVDVWDAAGIERGRFRYTNVKLNVGLTEKDFEPATHGLKAPK